MDYGYNIGTRYCIRRVYIAGVVPRYFSGLFAYRRTSTRYFCVGRSRPVVGTLTVPADAADPVELPIPVTLGDGWLVCFARYEGVNPADSPELRVLVAGTAPQIAFTSPRLARVATPTVRVAVRTVNVEDGQPVTLVVNGEAWPQDRKSVV